jgi:HAD superfamily hydrolase (TIGR01490 family)
MDLALFDFDGTLTTTDTFSRFMYFSSGPARIALGTLVLGPLLVGFRSGLVSGRTLRRASAAFCFRGRAVEDVARLGRRYAQTFEPLLRPEAMARLRGHQAKGDRVAIVSASLSVYLVPWTEAQGVDLLCTELEERGGVHTGGFRGSDCAGEEKARRVRARYDLKSYATIYAYGDTHEDHPLLRLATKRYFCGRELDPTVPLESLTSAVGG